MKAIVNNSCCQIFTREKLTRGTVGKTMEAEFSADWDGLAITAVFEAGDIKKDAVYTGDPIIIPHEVLATAGVSVMLGFHGALPDGTIVKRTEKEWINNVSETLDPAGVQSTEPTPDWTAQVQAIATEAKEVAESVRSDADAGRFKGATGAAGEAGGWYTPAVTQPDENTLRVAFTPSKEGMPAVADTDITLPASGGGGGSGEDGGYYAPSVDDEGNLTWTASKTDMPAVDGANIKGPKGDTGATGAQGPAGATGPAGADGKSAYQYAQDGGFTGTEAEFAAKLAKEIPETLPNPNALTFTGAVTGSYDGSAPVSVEIPSGGLTVTNTAAVGQTVRITDVDENGQPAAWEAVEFTGGDVWELLYETTLTEDAATFSQEIPTCSKVKMVIFPGADVSGFKQIVINGITYPALSSSLTKNQAFFVSIDTLTPPYITVATGIYYRPSVNGINGGNSASSYAMIDDSITTIGCGTAAILVTGTIVKIWGVRE